MELVSEEYVDGMFRRCYLRFEFPILKADNNLLADTFLRITPTFHDKEVGFKNIHLLRPKEFIG